MSVVVIPASTIVIAVLALPVGAIIVYVLLALYFRYQRARLEWQKADLAQQAAEQKKDVDQHAREKREEIFHEMLAERPTTELPRWHHTGGLVPDVSPSLEHRIIHRAENPNYPFLLPTSRDTPIPDVMRDPPRIRKVVMKKSDWITSYDQFGFIMNEYSGLWQNVGLQVMANFDGAWMVPKEKTGFHKITRFKYVRPQDQQMPPILHPRDCPEVAPPLPPSPPPFNEYSPA